MVPWIMTSEENKLLKQQQQQQQGANELDDANNNNNKKRRLLVGIIASILLAIIIIILLAIIFRKYPYYSKNNENDIYSADTDSPYKIDNNNNNNNNNKIKDQPKSSYLHYKEADKNRYKSPPKCSSKSCRDGWIFNNSQCYYFSSALTLRTYGQALEDCRQMNGWLSTIDDEFEKNFIFINTPLVQYWIDLIKVIDNNNRIYWKWNNGSPFHSSYYSKSWSPPSSSSSNTKKSADQSNAVYDSTVNDCFIQLNRNERKRFICESCN